MHSVRDWRTTVFVAKTQQITYTTYTIHHKTYTPQTILFKQHIQQKSGIT